LRTVGSQNVRNSSRRYSQNSTVNIHKKAGCEFIVNFRSKNCKKQLTVIQYIVIIYDYFICRKGGR
jgi:hypothetical protein